MNRTEHGFWCQWSGALLPLGRGSLCFLIFLSVQLGLPPSGRAAVNCGTLTSIGTGDDAGWGMAIQSDSKIVVVGHSHNGTNFDVAVVRYNADGTLDTSFDTDGRVTTPIGGADDFASAVAVQSDGKIVVAGRSDAGGGNFDFAVLRYNTDGSLDTTFNGTGIATLNIGTLEFGDAVTIQPDGKIVVAGRTQGPNFDIALIRYNTDGTLDTSFDTDGWVTTPVGAGNDYAKAVKVQAGGEIVVAGFYNNGANNDIAVLRYLSNGSLDTTFDGDGIATTAIGAGGDEAHALVIQPDGKIVVAGYSHNGSNNDIAVVRYNTNGSLDSSFDGDGRVITAIGAGEDTASSIALQSTGEIVVAGKSSNGANTDFAVVRYQSNGSLDTTFDGDGIAVTPVGVGFDQANAVAVRSDGTIVAAGLASNGTNQDLALVIYGSDGSTSCTVDFAHHPTGNGSANTFTSATGCAAGAHWDCVNDQAGNAGVGAVQANDASTFLQDASGSTNREMFSLDDGTLPASAVVTSIQIFAQVGKGAGPGVTASLSYQRMGFDPTPVDGPPTSVTGACCGLLISASWTGLAWTPAQLDTLQVGMVHNTGGVLQLSQLYVVVYYEISTEVELSSFTAGAEDCAVMLDWETASELSNLGFHLYRSTTEQGPYERITSTLIPGLGSSPVGARYRYRDAGRTNGVTYYYKLEDVETTGGTMLHGPVSATPEAALSRGSMAEEGERVPDGPALITYGDPSLNRLTVSKHGREVILDLRTEGFHAQPLRDGTVRLTVPNFEVESGEGSVALPVRRAWVEVEAGWRVRLASVRSEELASVEGLIPADAEQLDLKASADSTVRLSRRRPASEALARAQGTMLFPAEAAQLLSEGFQGTVKKVFVQMAPVRWDRSSSRLVLARRMVVRLTFPARDFRDIEFRGGGRRRHREPISHRKAAPGLVRLATVDPGLYAVSYEAVFRGTRGVDVRRLRLSRQGMPVPFHVEPEAGRFAPGSTLFFVSAGATANPYGPEAVYELEQALEGTMMPTAADRPSGSPANVYLHQFLREENRYYQAALLDAPSLWLWDVLMAPVRKRFRFEVRDIAPRSDPSALCVWLQGASDFAVSPDHHVRLYVNGTWFGETSWDGKSPKKIEMALPTSVLREGENYLEVENVGDTAATYSMIFLDRFTLAYPRRSVTIAGSLEGKWIEDGAGELLGMGRQRGYVLDVTAEPPVWLSGAEVGLDDVLRFHAEAGRRYLAVSHEAVHRPQVRRASPSRLKSEINRADYVIIGPRAFLDAAAPLIAFRQGQGLRVKAVSIEEVYSEFGFGETTPSALHDFLTHAYHHWQAPPRYVALLGDATYDYKNYLGTQVVNHVPPMMLRTSFLWTASDPAYARVNGEDPLPDIAIGRLPAASVEEVRVLTQKILSYETGEARGAPIVLVADNTDAAANFEAAAEQVAARLADSHELRRIYLGPLGTARTRESIKQAFDDGASVVSYLGHGGIHLWASENVFNLADVDSLSPQPQQPLLLTMNCLNGYFHFPYFNSLAEALVKSESKGAIAAFSPSGLSLHRAAERFHLALMQEIGRGAHGRLGDAVLAAQGAYADSGSPPELLAIYHLLGDPALTLR